MQTSFESKISHINLDSQADVEYCFETSTDKTKFYTFNFWKGNNEFKLNGKVVMGPAKDKIYMKAFLIAVLVYVFLFYCEIYPNINDIYVLIGFTISLILFLIFLILTIITEPGYLPHQNLLRIPETLCFKGSANKKLIERICGSSDYDFTKINNINIVKTEEKEKKESNLSKDFRFSDASNNTKIAEFLFNSGASRNQDIEKTLEKPLDSSSEDNTSMDLVTSDILVINSEINIKESKEIRYCFYCKIFKLERTAHCSKCNCCVRVFDHHCVIVNNCIGKRNYKYFIGMILSGSFMNAYFLYCLFSCLFAETTPFSTVSQFIYILALVQSIIFFALLFFHFVLYCVFNKTTNEYLRDKRMEAEVSEDFDGIFTSESLINFEAELNQNHTTWLKEL